MSDGLARVAGGGVPIEFDGQMIVLEPLTMKDFATIEQHLLSKRQNPLDMVKSRLEGLEPEVQKHLLELAYQDSKRMTTISPAEVGGFMDTVDGLAFTIWLCVQRSHPGRWTLENVENYVKSQSVLGIQNMLRARDQASGLDELGNSTGPRPGTATSTKAKKTVIAEVQVNGVESTGSSPSTTGTRRRKSTK